jgi:hypothetical protein
MRLRVVDQRGSDVMSFASAGVQRNSRPLSLQRPRAG